jgi:tight adherence protein C
MSFDMLIPLATFLAISLGIWGMLTAVAERKGRAGDRLERLLRGTGPRREVGGQLLRQQDRIQALVAKAAPALAKPLEGKAEEIGALRLRLLHAGFRAEQAVHVYLMIRVILLIVAILIVVPLVMLRGLSRGMILQAGGIIAVAFYGPSLVLGFLVKKRQESIFLSLPDALDLMVVCVEAGLGLDAAMRRVANELAASCPALCEELAIANFQIQMGRPRREVLHDLGRRTGVADLRALAAILIQAERFGSSIAVALRVQSDSMRTRRRQLAEERAAKTAVQLIFPLVLFIFPGIFVVLVGPAGIQISKTLLVMK